MTPPPEIPSQPLFSPTWTAIVNPSPLRRRDVQGQWTTPNGWHFRADFDSANLAKVEWVSASKIESANPSQGADGQSPQFDLYTLPDNGSLLELNSGNRTWFHFAVQGGELGVTANFTIKNLNKQSKLFSFDMRPVFRSGSMATYERIKFRVTYTPIPGGSEIRFSHTFHCLPSEETFFALTYPFSYAASCELLDRLENRYSLPATTDSQEGASIPPSLSPPAGPRMSAISPGRLEDAIATSSPPITDLAITDSGSMGATSNDAEAYTTSDDFKPVTRRGSCPGGTAPGAKSKALTLALPAARRPARSKHSGIFFYRETLIHSLEGRPVELLTITSAEGMDVAKSGQGVVREPRLGGLFPDTSKPRPPKFPPDRKFFFVSARVHPGEVPASHIFNGMLEFLLRADDPRAAALRSAYVFQLIPMLNPDGVFHGHYRTDTNGANLNRFYDGDMVDRARYPTVFAAKTLATHLADPGKASTGACHATGRGQAAPSGASWEGVDFARGGGGGDDNSGAGGAEGACPPGRLEFYIDLHAHANKRGCFIFGNALEGERQVSNVLFAKLVSLNNPHFDYGQCNFSEQNMRSRDKRDDLSKEGSGRVALYAATGLTHIYTVECNYNTSRILNPVPAIAISNSSKPHRPRLRNTPPSVAFLSGGASSGTRRQASAGESSSVSAGTMNASKNGVTVATASLTAQSDNDSAGTETSSLAPSPAASPSPGPKAATTATTGGRPPARRHSLTSADTDVGSGNRLAPLLGAATTLAGSPGPVVTGQAPLHLRGVSTSVGAAGPPLSQPRRSGSDVPAKGKQRGADDTSFGAGAKVSGGSRSSGGKVEESAGGERHMSPPGTARQPAPLTVTDMERIGRALLTSALDLHGINPWSRIPNTVYGSVAGVRKWVAATLLSGSGFVDEVAPGPISRERSAAGALLTSSEGGKGK